MFEPKIMDFLALFVWWRGHLLFNMKVFLVWNGYHLKQEMSERGGEPLYVCRKANSWLLVVVGSHKFLNVLSRKRSPHLHVDYSGGGDPLLNVLSAKMVTIPEFCLLVVVRTHA